MSDSIHQFRPIAGTQEHASGVPIRGNRGARVDGASQLNQPTGSSLADQTERSDLALLRTIVMLLGIGWSLAFIVVGCGFGLQMYGDGSIFSYAIAAEQAWAFHWHNISGRVFVYLLAHWPAETYVRLSGDANGGVILHGLLFFCAPLVGLYATWRVDQSEDRSFFLHACASTAVICPLVFGFPTEMWVAHAVFWPMLAVARSADQSLTRTAVFAAGLTALMLSHGGGVLLAGVIVASALLPGPQLQSRPRMLIGGGIAVFGGPQCCSHSARILTSPKSSTRLPSASSICAI